MWSSTLTAVLGLIVSFALGTALATSIQPAVISGRTGAIGGAMLLAGNCTSGTATLGGAQVGMVATATPDTLPVALGTALTWDAHVSAPDTVTVRVCAVVAITPTAVAYNVRVIR